MQGLEEIVNNKGIFFSAMGMVIDKKYIWFAARETNGLFRVGLREKRMEYVGSFPNELEDNTYMYGGCVVNQGRIFFAPINASRLAVYDIEKKQFFEYPLEEVGIKAGYFTIISWKEKIILLPAKRGNEIIIVISTDNWQVRYLKEWNSQFVLEDDLSENLFYDYCIDDNFLYAPIICSKGEIMKYDLLTDEISCIKLEEKKHFRGICCDKEKFYLFEQNGNEMVVLNKNYEVMEKRTVIEKNSIRINNVVFQNGKVFLFTINDFDSMDSDMIIGLDTKTQEVRILFNGMCNTTRKNCSSLGRVFSVVTELDDLIWVLNGGNGVLYKINSNDMTICTDEVEGIQMAQILCEKYMRCEGDVLLLEKRSGCNELNLVLGMIDDMKKDKKRDIAFGKIIWEALR